MKKWINTILPITIVLIGVLSFGLSAHAVTFFEASDVTAMNFSPWRGGVSVEWTISGHGSSVWESMGTFREKETYLTSSYIDGSEFSIQTATKLTTHDYGQDHQAGDILIVSFNKGSAYIYLPAFEQWQYSAFYLATKFNANGIYYVGTYSDEACTQLLQAALAYSPTPIPSVTPSPTARITTPTPSTTLTPIPSASPTASVVPTPASTSTPSPIPTLTPASAPSATPPCSVGTALTAWSIDDVDITTTRGQDGSNSWRIDFIASGNRIGYITDWGDTYTSTGNLGYGGQLSIQAVPLDASTVEIRSGDSVDITIGAVTTRAYFTNVTDTTVFYVGIDGTTYLDTNLCKIAGNAAAPSPSPSPVISPTPVQTDCLTLISYPYTADETSIYDLLNLDFAAIVDAQNEHCFRSPIGQVDIAPNAIGNEELRDYAVHTEEILNNTILGGSDGDIAGSTITSFNINTNSFDYSDVFPKANEIVIPYNNASGVSSPQWEVMCMPYWNNLSGSFSINYNTTTSDRERIIFIDKDTLWMSVGGEIPTATLDVNGPMRVRGSLTLDRGLVQQWVAFDAGDATPFVRDGTRFYTANTAANPGTISNFDGAESGHEFYLWVNDTDTTWAATTGNINFTTATTSSEDELYKFLRMGDKWYEVGHWDYGPITGSGSPSDVYAFEGFESDSFSGGDGDWSGPWVISGNTTTSSRYAHTGTYSSAVYYDGASLYRGINTSSGTVTLSMWIYAHYGSPTLHIYDSVNTTTWNELTSKAFTGAWQEWSYTWTMADKQPEYIKFAVTSVNDAVVRLYLDDITIE